MKLVSHVVATIAVLSLCSCSIYLKDMVDGSPYERAYAKAYDEAIAEGLGHKAAHNRALLAGGSNHHEVWEERRKEEREEEEWDEFMGTDSSDDLKIRWN